ncbi:MAG: hypothetical protein KUG77_26670 [Nannocystaceae bacterium]|nr:hypothetical protein [Nannocystaceae bacterium]
MDVTECENCGGIVVFDTHVEAVKCVFCGDVSLTATELQALEQPAVAVPFAVSDADARGLFRAWAKGSFWTPSAFRSRDIALETLWVPAWRVRAEVHATWTGLVNAKTRSGKRPESGTNVGNREAWVPASLGLTQAELAALAPFPADHCVAWNPRSAKAAYEVAGSSAQTATIEARAQFREAVRAELIRDKRLRDCRASVLLREVDTAAVMLPVYVGCVRFADQPWRFVINGQTGRVTGKSPVDSKKIALVLALIATLALVWAWWI